MTPFFVLRALPAWDGLPRLAITVSRKTEKHAVDRNRLRRRLVAAAEAAGFPEPGRTACRIVVIGHAEAKTAPFSELVAAFRIAFDRLAAWHFPPPPKTTIRDIPPSKNEA